MSSSRIDSLKIKAKLLQKAKKKVGESIKLKEALHKIATLSGFSSWRELKNIVEETDFFCPPRTSNYWKVWYASYEEAYAHLTNHGGFLLPYHKQFFICDADYIERLGVLKGDPDLEKVGSNWVKPMDGEAWRRIVAKVRARRV